MGFVTRATSSRNGWATSNRNSGRDHLGMLGDIGRKPHLTSDERPQPNWALVGARAAAEEGYSVASQLNCVPLVSFRRQITRSEITAEGSR